MIASRFTLPGEGQRHAFELLVVLELDGVQAGEFDRDGRGAGDPGRGVVVGDVDLLHIPPGDHVALRRAPVAGDAAPRPGTSARRWWCRAAAEELGVIAAALPMPAGSSSGASRRR